MITRPCPSCGNLIIPDALICPHCQTVNPFVKAAKRERTKNAFLAAIAIFLAGVVIRFSFWT
ncbi:zinc ribbon domain-containing protein [Citrobacter meridianamericanus]|uniref:zinc ribbon domain-containing protein n=1 Tax=Citrobacter meridianamericanus TaxID=2894201 RepID=UPI00351D2DD8